MLKREALKDLIHSKELGRKDKLLIVLATDDAAARTVAQIRDLAINAGLREAKKWNISDVLASGEVLAVRTDVGWELNIEGKKRVGALVGSGVAPPTTSQAAIDLRAHLSSISSAETLAFLDEAVACLEHGLLRAAVVLSWVGAVSVLYEHVINHHLSAFNAEAAKRDGKWKNAKNADDLARMKEHEFLNVLEAISVIGKNVKQELQASLALRNGCGHPNSLKIGSQKVAAHIEVLILNVFTKF